MPRTTWFGATSAFVTLASLAPAQWDQRTPTATPPARVNAAMTWDGASNKVLLFGGTTSSPAPSGQTWLYDGVDWLLATPATSPTGRFGAELAFDSVRGVTVLYGGWTSSISIGTANDETWEWNGSTWTQRTPAATPGGLFNYAMAFDPTRARTVLYGGAVTLTFPIAQNGTWEYDGTTWTPVTTVGNPGPLERASMCFHAASNRIVLFGGVGQAGVATDTTWTYDGTTWLAAPVAGARPPARTGASMVYDSVREVCVLTSGMHPGTGVRFTDTWEWDGVAWAQQPTATTGVLDGSVAFLPTTRQVVKFGGLVASVPFQLDAATWEFGAKNGTFGAGCNGTFGPPALAAVDAPRLGLPYVVNATNLHPSFSSGLLFFGFGQITPFDLGIVGMPSCLAHTGLTVVLGVAGSGGTASWTWPTVSGAIGDTFFGQMLSLDPSATALGYTISNAIYARIGY